jgi:WD40 repeat protein
VKTRVNTISLSPNGKTIASGNGDVIVRMWDVETGKVIAKRKSTLVVCAGVQMVGAAGERLGQDG